MGLDVVCFCQEWKMMDTLQLRCNDYGINSYNCWTMDNTMDTAITIKTIIVVLYDKEKLQYGFGFLLSTGDTVKKENYRVYTIKIILTVSL